MKHIDEEVQKMTGATVAQTMTKNVVTIHPDLGIDEIATLMVEKSYHTLPVVEEGRLVGIVGKEDVLKTLVSVAEKE
jgi:CBS domain-containing protein